VTENWRIAFPKAYAGVLVIRNVTNPPHHPGLENQKGILEDQLRSDYGEKDRRTLETMPVLQAYHAYYTRFKKTYHVHLQLESIVARGKSIPRVAALVEVMFMAEVKNMLLTAGHDLDTVQLPVTLDVAKGDEKYTLLRGQEQVPKAGDMLMRDRAGVISSIIYGPDQRTQIRAGTHNVIFTVYAPPGIAMEALIDHLQDIQEYIRLIAPGAHTEMLKVFGAG
jgi:DNA/RNA-binding domain of Phe-tRNA-synthetase-like protein